MTGKLATAMAAALLPVATVFGDMWGDFVDPPDSAKPWAYYLWQNGLADRETITADLEAMKRLGFGGINMLDTRGYWDDEEHVVIPKEEIVWGSPEWYDLVEFCIRECARLGLEFTMNCAASGGSMISYIDGKPHEADVLDRADVTAHLDRALGPILKRVPDLVGTTFTHIYSVSYEGNVKTGGSWKTIKDTFYATMREWAHAHGLKIYSESGGPWGWGSGSTPLDCSQLDLLAHNDFPQGEFWPNREWGDAPDVGHANANARYFQRGIVLSARREGHRIVSMEAFTHMLRHYSVDPAFLKPTADMAFADGANRMVWHTFTSSPKKFGIPGNEYFAGSHINRNVTWHKDADGFVKYLGRCQSLLQRGEYVDDGEFADVKTNYYGYGRFRKEPNAQFTMIHRREGDSEWFFVAGEGKGEVELNAPCEGRTVEIWDAVAGTRSPAASAALPDGKTRVSLDLPVGGSCFVVFAPSGTGEDSRVEHVDRVEVCITNAWNVSFAYHDGISAKPPAPVTMETLRDLTTYGVDGDAASTSLRYFSGTATYRTTVKVKGEGEGKGEWKGEGFLTLTSNLNLSNFNLRLSLGKIPSGLAHVFVNGVDCGVAWCAPWEVSVPASAIRSGENEIEIRYTNNWFNRLVGDCFLKPEERVTRSTLRYSAKPRAKSDPKRPWFLLPSIYSGPAVSDRLQHSGLLGPIALKLARESKAVLSPLPVSRAPFERSKEVSRRPVSFATWPFHPQGGWTLLGEQRLTTWAEFRSGDKSVVANGYNGLIHHVGRTGFGKLLFYRGGGETTSPAAKQRSDPYGRELLAWMEVRVLDGTRYNNRYMECYSNATIKVDEKASRVDWSRSCRVNGVKDAVVRYSLAPAGDGMLSLDYGFDGAFDGKPQPPVEFRLYLCGNSTNGVSGVENGTRLYVNRNSETERVEIGFPEGKVEATSAEELAKANGNNPVPSYIWRTDAASGRVLIDLCGSTTTNSSTLNSSTLNASTPNSGIIDFYETDALNVPRDPTGNMLANGSFEQGLSGWNFYWGGVPWGVAAESGGALVSVVDEAKAGDKALCMRPAKGRGYEILQSAPMSLEPGADHVFSAWVKRTKGEQGRATLTVWIEGIKKFSTVAKPGEDKSEKVTHTLQLADDEWHFVEIPFVPECDDCRIVFSGGGASTVVDGVRVERKGKGFSRVERVEHVEGRLETASAENIVNWGTPIDARLVLSGPDGVEGAVRVTVRNFYNETVYDTTLPFALPKDKVLPLDFDSVKLGTGVFVLGAEFDVKNNLGNYRSPYQRFVILKPLDGKHQTADFFVQAPHYVKSSIGDKLGRYAKALGYTRTNWEPNARLSDTNSPEVKLRMRLGVENRLHTVSTELNRKYPDRFGYGKNEGLNSFTNVVPEKVAFIEQEAYEAGLKAAKDDIYWALWNEEDAENREIRYAKTSEDRRKACEVWFAYQYACWKGLKKAFDERGMKLMYAPTHGCGNYNADWCGRETMDFYMDIAAKHNFRYDFIAIHTYGALDGSFLGSADRDENAALLLARMAHYGYPETTPVMFSEGYNILPFSIPRWGALATCDNYPNGGPASLDLGWREFLQAGLMARLYVMDLKYWPRVMNSHTWQYRLVADAQMSPFMWNMVPNTLGHLLPSPKFVGDVKRDGWRAYVFRQDDHGVAAVWTNERQVELGRKKGRTLKLALPKGVGFVDLMGNDRAATSADADGTVSIPLTPAPIFILSKDTEGLLTALENCETVIMKGTKEI